MIKQTTPFVVVSSYTGHAYETKLVKETKCFYVVLVKHFNTGAKWLEMRFHKNTMTTDGGAVTLIKREEPAPTKNDYEAVKPAKEDTPASDDREAWLIEAGDYLMNDILAPLAKEHGLKTPPVKYSVSYAPNTRTGSATLGVCSSRSASTGGHNEIFISPELDGSRSDDVMGVLLHELIHAYLDNEDGHKGRFAKIATKVGFERPLTTFKPSSDLKEILASYIDLLGPIPHDKLDYGSIKKKQKSRHLLVRCSHEECEFQFRTSRKQVDLMQHSTCLICGDESLVLIDDH